jgi:hypothetical protein
MTDQIELGKYILALAFRISVLRSLDPLYHPPLRKKLALKLYLEEKICRPGCVSAACRGRFDGDNV